MTSGISAANSRARLTREWKEMVRCRSYFRIAFARPICPARVRASVIFLPSRVTELALLRPLLVGRVVHADDGDLVVGQQVPLDRLTEREAVEHRARTSSGRPSRRLQGRLPAPPSAPDP